LRTSNINRQETNPEFVTTAGATRRRKRHSRAAGTRRGDRGSALVIVVGVIAILTVMLLHLTVVSGIIAREAQVSAARTHLRYEAESAAEHACWLYLSDRKNHPSRGIQTAADIDLAVEDQEERWQADGVNHALQLGRFQADIAVLDADRGLDISGANPANSFRKLLTEEDNDDPGIQEIVSYVVDQLADYVDGGDDFRRLNGMERDDYEAEGWPDLPRNSPFQFREEILWIEAIPEAMGLLGWSNAGDVVKAFRLVPPRGLKFPRNQKPSFFGASPILVRTQLDISDVEVDDVLDARNRWQRGDSAALDELSTELANQIRSAFSFNESGIVTITATARMPGGEIARTVRITRDCRTPPNANATVPVWNNWETQLDPTPSR